MIDGCKNNIKDPQRRKKRICMLKKKNLLGKWIDLCVCLLSLDFPFPNKILFCFCLGFVDESRKRWETKFTCWSTCVRRVKNWISKKKKTMHLIIAKSPFDLLWFEVSVGFSLRVTFLLISSRTEKFYTKKSFQRRRRKTVNIHFRFSCLPSFTSQKMKIDLLSLFWFFFRFCRFACKSNWH